MTPQSRPAALGPNFRMLVGSSAATNLGDGLMSVAVVWLSTALTRDPVLVTLVALSTRLPWLLFTLHAGVLADRFDRRSLVALMDAIRAVVVAVLTAGVVTVQGRLTDPGQIAAGAPQTPGWEAMLTSLCVAAFLLGTAEVIRDNAAQTLLPAIVPGTRLETANSRLWGVETVMNSFIGPPLAGVLLGLAAALPFGVYTALLVIASIFVSRIRPEPSESPVTAPAGNRTSWSHDIAEGFHWLWSHSVLRSLALALGALNFFGALTSAVFILFVQDVLGLFEGWQFGLVLTGMATGAVVGSLTGDRVADRMRHGTALALCVVVMSASILVVGVSSHALTVWVAGAVEGFAILLWNVIVVSFRQRIIPDALLGRVNSVYRLFGWGTISVGALMGGLVVALSEPLLGREWALRSVFLLTAAGTLTVLALVIRHLNNRAIEASLHAATIRENE